MAHCTSTSRRGSPSACTRSTSPTRATFEASRTAWNIDSPANRPPTETPYRPPTSSPSCQVSTLCAQPELVEAAVGLGDLAGDPAALAGGVGAALDHLVEGGVDAHLEAVERPAQGAPHPQRPDRHDAARVGRPPPDRAPTVPAQAHGEQPEAVGREQRAGLEVGAGGHEVVTGRGPRRVEQPRRPRGLDGREDHRGGAVGSVAGVRTSGRDLLGGLGAVGRLRTARGSCSG